jgi:hypothetical protein
VHIRTTCGVPAHIAMLPAALAFIGPLAGRRLIV